MEQELRYLGEALDHPKRPFVAVLGGAKISGKIDVIQALLPKVDEILIGGAMANTFFLAIDFRWAAPSSSATGGPRKELLAKAGAKLILPRARSWLRVSRAPPNGRRCRAIASPPTPPSSTSIAHRLGLPRADPEGQDRLLERPHGRGRDAAVSTRGPAPSGKR